MGRKDLKYPAALIMKSSVNVGSGAMPERLAAKSAHTGASNTTEKPR